MSAAVAEPATKQRRTEGGPATTTVDATGAHAAAATAAGPFSLLNTAVNTKREVFITCRDGRRLISKVRAFDKHFNMLLVDVIEVVAQQQHGHGNSSNGSASNMTTRNFDNIFLRGDSVVHVGLPPV